MIQILSHTLLVLFLTALTQIGGVAWLVALFFRWRLLTFVAVYFLFSLSALWLAPHFGRVALSCFDNDRLQVQSWFYCAFNRNYVTPELAEVLQQAADKMEQHFPDTTTLVLDGNFPFMDGFPLLPHLSHNDGRKADIAFYYRKNSEYVPGATPSPIGYFAFEQGSTDCRETWPTLRWDFDFLQPLWPHYELDSERTGAVLRFLAADNRIGKIFVEPHLASSLKVAHPKIRFQGCRAARHDDHIHLQLK